MKILNVINVIFFCVQEIDESTKRNIEKREKIIYGNWRRLIRGLLIKERLKIKYSFGENSNDLNTTCENRGK